MKGSLTIRILDSPEIRLQYRKITIQEEFRYSFLVKWNPKETPRYRKFRVVGGIVSPNSKPHQTNL